MESYFTSLDDFQQTNKPDDISLDTSTIRCCDNIDNYMPCEEHTLCRICNQPITVLNSNPEKCYDGGKQTSRVGMPSSELLPDSTSGSVIINKFISNPNMRNISRLHVYQGIPYKVRSLLVVFNTISEKCNRHNISKKIQNEAHGLYRIVSQYKISRGSNRLGIIASVIFMACKNCCSPRSSSEIAKIMEVNRKIVTKGIKQLNDIIRINKISLDRVILDRVTAIDLIDRSCNDICELSIEQINDIKLLCSYLTDNHKKELSSCTPPSLSAAVINYYILSNQINIDKTIISEKSNVSIVTIQKITNMIISILNN